MSDRKVALRVLNLGAGVQSSTLAMMYQLGELGPLPDVAIFADTGWEPKKVYTWLEHLEGNLTRIPVHRVKAKTPNRASGLGLRHDMLVGATTKASFNALPLYTESRNGGGQLARVCTKEYKIEPIERHIRELLGVKRVPRGVAVEQLFGISLDEKYRAKPSPVSWVVRRWPLIFERPMTRADCLEWWKAHNYPTPPRSACIGCPYHSDYEWRDMKLNRPEEWADAVEFDKIIRAGVRGTKEKCYLHSDLKPLGEVDLSTPEDHGQLRLFDASWFPGCEDGMCGF